MFWVFVDNVFLKGFSFVGTLLLAKILTPNDFGLIAIITIFVSLGSIIVDSGLSSSLIRNVINEESDYCTVFFINLLLSLVMYLIVFFCAPIIANFYMQPILTSIIRVYSLSFIITALSSVQIVVLLKGLQFKKIMYLNIPVVLIGNILALLMGYNGFGVWSIVAMFLLPQLFQMITLWFGSGWKPKWIFSFDKLKYHYVFSFRLLISSLISGFFCNLNNLIIGKIYPLRKLGYFDRGKTLSQYPLIILTQVIGKVTLPVFSEIQGEKDKFISVFKKLLDFSFFITAPIMFGLSAISKPLVMIILGEKWMPSASILQIICIGGAFYTIEVLNINVIKIYGRSDLILKKEIVTNLFILLTVSISYFIGFYAFLWSIVLNYLFTTIISMYFSKTVINLPVKFQLKIISIVLINSLLMYLVMYLFQIMFCVGMNPILEFIFMIIVGFISFVSFSFIFKSPSFSYCTDWIKNKILKI